MGVASQSDDRGPGEIGHGARSSQEPFEFAADATAEGRKWIATLPALIRKLSLQWGLRIEEAKPERGYSGIVMLARRGDEPCVLKVTWPQNRTADEVRVLAAWDGHGAVRLLESSEEHGAVLLERLNSRKTLGELNLFDAACVAGQLLRRLAIPAPEGFRSLQDVAKEIVETLSQTSGSR